MDRLIDEFGASARRDGAKIVQGTCLIFVGAWRWVIVTQGGVIGSRSRRAGRQSASSTR